MFILVNGNNSYSSYEGLETVLEESKSLMRKMDKELTLFCIGPQNILDLVKDYAVKNEQLREKRVKYYSYTPEMATSYGLEGFDYYVNLSSVGEESLQKISEGFKLV
jgi:hypothetical protein